MKIDINRVDSYILCNIKKHEPDLDVDYEELQNFNFVQLDEEEVSAVFPMINSNLLIQIWRIIIL